MKYRYLNRIIISLIVTGCQFQKQDNLAKSLQTYFDSVHHIKTDVSLLKAVIFVPQNGCGFCVSKTMTELESANFESKSFKVVVSGYDKVQIQTAVRKLSNLDTNLLVDNRLQYEKYLKFTADNPFYMVRENGSFVINEIDAKNYEIEFKKLRNLLN